MSRRSSRAPQNESIRQEDLRADLFFLAGDSLRGRLTDTEENRAAADFIRSRFERLGLKGAGPNGSFFQPYNLMTATLGDAAPTGSRSAPSDGVAAAPPPRGRSSIRTASAPAGTPPAPVVFVGLRHQRAASRLRRLQRRRQRQDRPRARPRAGRARSEQPVRRRRHVRAVDGVAQGAGGAGEGRGRRCCSSATCTTIRARRTSRRPRATTGRRSRRSILSYTLAAWADRIRIPVAQISPAVAASLLAGSGKTLEELSQVRGNGARVHGAGAAGDAASISAPRSTATSSPTATSSRCSKGATRG